MLFLGIGMASAQPGNRDPEARIQQREIEGLTEGIYLYQKTRWQKLNRFLNQLRKNKSKLFAEMRDSGDMDREKMRETMTKMRTEQDEKIKAVLTEDQVKKLVKYREEQAEQRRSENGEDKKFVLHLL